MEWVNQWAALVWSIGWARALVIIASSLAAAQLFQVTAIGVLNRWAKSALHQTLLEVLRRPIYLSVLMLGLYLAVDELGVSSRLNAIVEAFLWSAAILLWSFALLRSGTLGLKEMAKHAPQSGFLQPRTLPLFDILIKTGVLAGGIYSLMLAWNIDLGAWLASAGIVGVAVGLAARDSLANYFAGVFIIADAPYKLRDIITLDDGTRGRVTDIGLRSTRIHTRDGIEINIPNSILSGMRIENRTAGPSHEERMTMRVGVAYGSDTERVVRVLHQSADGMPARAKGRDAEVYFVGFGSSSLDFELKVWVVDPAQIEIVMHDLHMRVYRAFAEAGIQIPFPQNDVHIKHWPAPPPGHLDPAQLDKETHPGDPPSLAS